MHRILSAKLFAFVTLLLFSARTANSQTCTGSANTTSTSTAACITPTDQFVTASFGTTSGDFSYIAGTPTGKYETASQTGQRSITSYALTIQNNVFSVGAQITAFVSRLDRGNTATKIEILNASTKNPICQALVGIQANGCFSASFSGLNGQNVRIRFTFTKTTNGNVDLDNFATDPAQALNPLPVTFAGFEGKKTAKGTALTWNVGSEVNVKSYDVERSSNGSSGFAKIGSVPATGSSSYTFTDETNSSGAVFYRIKNIDNDGRFAYSTILSLRNGSGAIVFRVVPTLVVNTTKVQHPAATPNASITLSGADGRQVRNIRPATGAVETTMDIANLRPGLYLLKWSDGGTTETTKVVKQ